MKIFQSPLLFIVAGIFMLSSCATVNNLNGKLIVGSWKNVKVLGCSSASSTDETAAVEMKQMIRGTGESMDISSMLGRYPEMTSAIEFKADNTVKITAEKNTVQGNWKINKTGTKITITGPDKKKIAMIELKRVDATTMELVDPFSVCLNGNFILLFRKQ